MTLLANNFYLLAPYGVGASEMTIGPPDAENQVYDAGTTYATGDEVWDAGNVYRSLQDSNTGNATSDGAWWEDLGPIDEGALEYDPATTYNTDDYTVDGGYLWQCAADGTLAVTPSTTATEWTQVGRTNRYKAFDGFLQDMASLSGGLTYQLTFSQIVSEVAILRATGSSAQVIMTDSVDGEVYNETQSLLDDSPIEDWWDYFFTDLIQLDTLIFDDMPPYTNADIDVIITGSDASVAQIVLGSGLALGRVKVGTSVGIESYSIKDRDDFNRSIVVARPYSDTVDFDLAIPAQTVGYVKRRLAERDALASLYYMADGELLGAVAYGFFQNFDILHSTYKVADCVLEIEGLG